MCLHSYLSACLSFIACLKPLSLCKCPLDRIIEALCYGISSRIILKTLVLLTNFIERCNLIPNLGNSDSLVHENHDSFLSLIIHSMY